MRGRNNKKNNKGIANNNNPKKKKSNSRKKLALLTCATQVMHLSVLITEETTEKDTCRDKAGTELESEEEVVAKVVVAAIVTNKASDPIVCKEKGT